MLQFGDPPSVPLLLHLLRNLHLLFTQPLQLAKLILWIYLNLFIKTRFNLQMKKGVEIKDSSKSCQQEKEAAKFYIVSWRLQIFTHYCRYLQQNYFVILKGNTANVSSISNGIHNTTANLHYIFVVESWFLQLAKSF